jgi:hypothetical protein
VVFRYAKELINEENERRAFDNINWNQSRVREYRSLLTPYDQFRHEYLDENNKFRFSKKKRIQMI